MRSQSQEVAELRCEPRQPHSRASCSIHWQGLAMQQRKSKAGPRDRESKHPESICTLLQQFVVIYIHSDCQAHQAKYRMFHVTVFKWKGVCNEFWKYTEPKKVKNIKDALPYDPTIPLLGICPKELKTGTPTKIEPHYYS